MDEGNNKINDDINKDNNIEESTKEKENAIEELIQQDKEVKDKNNNLKKKKFILIGIILLIIVIFSVFIKLYVNKYEDVVYPGITVYNQDVSKLNKKELDNELKKLSKKINSNKICISAKDKNYSIDVKDVVLEYNINELCEEIFSYGKDKNTFLNFCKVITKKDKAFNFDVTINDSSLLNLKEKIANETNIKAQEPQVIINGSNISYKDGKDGSKLLEKLLIEEIEKSLEQKNAINKVININAIYEDDKQTISIDDLKSVNSKISTYSTTYSPSGGRGSNVENAANKLDNMVLMPGDEFSYENAVGPVIQSNGYTYAPVISGGKLIQGIGGGVCQVSSTLYNTMLNSGILPTERRNHSKPVSYVPRGLDATLASGSIDYKFINTLEYPIVINTSCSNGNLTIEFWSNENALKGIEYEAVSYISGRTANSYLYGYNKDGDKIYEKHIDTSIYR